MKKFLTIVLAGFGFCLAVAQTDPRIAKTKTPLSQVGQSIMPVLDNEALLASELARRAPGVAPKFAETIEVQISPNTHGHWEVLPNGKSVWRLRIRSVGAKSLNLGFTKYVMPAGGSLILYSPDYQQVMGPFTPADNEVHEQLWTPVLPSDELVVEVQIPTHSQPQLELELKYVNHDFIGFASVVSGSCNLDVICGAADGWAIVDAYRDIIQSVAVISTGGGTFCTGFLVNNARQDCAPFFMTANHCGINAGAAPSLVTYWNFQNSTCRQPNSAASGGNGNGQLNDFNTGSIWRSSWANSDFTLVELDDPVSATADAFFAGWSAEDVVPSDTVICVHHPSTDEKRISFEFDPTHLGTWGTGGDPVPNGNHIIIPDWDIGTTEGGSSGSPLFNNQKQVVGQLHGGNAACGNNAYDSYGWFRSSWEGGGTPASRLKDWLDPDNTGILSIGGRSQLQCSFFVDAAPANASICTPADVVFELNVSANFAGNVLLDLANLPAGLTYAFGTNPVAPGGSTTLTISNTGVLAEGSYTLELTGTDGSNSFSGDLGIVASTQLPTVASVNTPADGSTGIGLNPNFSWPASAAATYDIEVSTDPDFNNIIASGTGLATGAYLSPAQLLSQTTYFWRVKGKNICGEGDWSPVFEFETAAIYCASGSSVQVPVAISSAGTPTVTSTFNFTGTGNVDDLNLTNLNINHTWVGDLRVELTSPAGTTITIFANPGGGDCDGNNVQLGFDDEATSAYTVFDQTCNNTNPSISGDFQPLEPLSTFNGEPANGIWTLTVNDDVNQDGGELLSWGLDICNTVPEDLSVFPSAEAVESCLGEAIEFTVQLGGGFDGSNGVTLTAESLPAGANASFEPNPAQPGSTVAVTLTGAASAGEFTFDVIATDGFGNLANAEIVWTVNGAPSSPAAVSPSQGADNVAFSPSISWTATGTSYVFALATDMGMTNIVFSGTPATNSQLVTNLSPCTTYFWTVAAQTECGISIPTEVFSFTTLDDLSFDASPTSVSICNTTDASTTLSLGPCFEAGGVMLSASGLPAGMSVAFDNNPAVANSDVTAYFTLLNVTPGSYTISITGNDGTNNVSENFTINVTGPAASPALVEPANAAADVDVETVFDWNTVPGASSYKFELATDDDFSNIVADETIPQTTYTLAAPLNTLTTYYWRVTAFNNCGGTTPAPFSFTTWLANSTHELDGAAVNISPNPTAGQLLVTLSSPIPSSLELEVFAANGTRLSSSQVKPGQVSALVDLSGYPDGAYFVKLKSATGVFTEKIILHQ